MRTCDDCEQDKPDDQFSRGHRRCKPCRAALMRAARAGSAGEAMREVDRARNRSFRRRMQLKRNSRRYYLAHEAEHQERNAAWWEAHPGRQDEVRAESNRKLGKVNP